MSSVPTSTERAATRERTHSRLARVAGSWLPRRSRDAALRAARTTVVVAGLLALAIEVIGNPQTATFAGFGGFATLLLSSFGGTRREKLLAHLGLALAGSALLTIGTAVAHTVLLGGLVTLAVVFAVLFCGLAAPNAAAGTTGALLAYVLPAASPGTMAMVPDRLAGWWLASLAGTAAVLLTSGIEARDGLTASASRLAAELAGCLEQALDGRLDPGALPAAAEGAQELVASFTATPLRPLGWSARDQAVANAVQLLEWSAALVADALTELPDLRPASDEDRELLAASAAVLRGLARELSGAGEAPALDRLELGLAGAAERMGRLQSSTPGYRAIARAAFHAQMIARATVSAAGAVSAGEHARPDTPAPPAPEQLPGSRARGLAGAAAAHASVRSVWLVNSLRGAAALAVAVAVANAGNLQHGFWVVLGTLSVLRSNASATGASALRALVGTIAGFAVGGLLLVAIGADRTGLWIVLPLAVCAAAYAPGYAPFAVGQAAFTVTVAVLFNLLEPVGWKVGVVRVEDVAIGCAISVVIGGLVWPRGAAAVVGDDLADSYRRGSAFLQEAIDWVAGSRRRAPQQAASVARAAIRLDEALRAFITERGAKHLSQAEMWQLVGGSLRLRLTAEAVAQLPPSCAGGDRAREALERRARVIVAWYEQLAALLGTPRGSPIPVLVAPELGPDTVVGASFGTPYSVWICEHLDHLAEHLAELPAPSRKVAVTRQAPWWR